MQHILNIEYLCVGVCYFGESSILSRINEMNSPSSLRISFNSSIVEEASVSPSIFSSPPNKSNWS